MQRKASAHWQGDIRSGKGTISTASGVLHDTAYSFNTRFADGIGTNPEELLGAAHAGCFAMALSLVLGDFGMTAEDIRATATVTLDKVDGGFAITASHLDVTCKIPGADPEKFQQAAATAKVNCPLSKVLNAKVTMNATLEA